MSGCISDLYRHIPFVAALGSVLQQGFQPGQVGAEVNLLGPWELRKQGIDRGHMESRHQFLQFRVQDAHQPED